MAAAGPPSRAAVRPSAGALASLQSAERRRAAAEWPGGPSERESILHEARAAALSLLFSGSEAGEDSDWEGRKSVKWESGRPSPPPPRPSAGPAAAARIAGLLAVPELMVAVPANLSSEWLAYRRPAGARAVLIAAMGRARIFGKNGYNLFDDGGGGEGAFNTLLPPQGCTILDGYLVGGGAAGAGGGGVGGAARRHGAADAADAADAASAAAAGAGFAAAAGGGAPSFIVCDCIMWGDATTGDADAECRLFLLQSRFEELGSLVGARAPAVNALPLQLVEFRPATPEAICELHAAARGEGGAAPAAVAASPPPPTPSAALPPSVPAPPCPPAAYASDALCFVHRESSYAAGHADWLLLWQDCEITPWPVHTTNVACALDEATGELVAPATDFGRNVPAAPPGARRPPTADPTVPVPLSRQQANLTLRLRDFALLTLERAVVARLDPAATRAALAALEPETVFLRLYRGGKLKRELPVRVSFDGLAGAAPPGVALLAAPPPPAEKSVTTSPPRSPPPPALLQNVTIDTTPSPRAAGAESLGKLVHQFFARLEFAALVRQLTAGPPEPASAPGPLFLPKCVRHLSPLQLRLAERALADAAAAPPWAAGLAPAIADVVHCAETGANDFRLWAAVCDRCVLPPPEHDGDDDAGGEQGEGTAAVAAGLASRLLPRR